MENKKRNIIIGIVILIIIVILIAVFGNKKNKNKQNENEQTDNQVTEEFVNVLDDGTRLNTSNKLKETKTIDGMEISNFQLTAKDNVTILLGTITNKSDAVKGDYPVNIKILDKQGNEIITVGGYIGELQPGATTQLNCSATFDYANAYDFEITKK